MTPEPIESSGGGDEAALDAELSRLMRHEPPAPQPECPSAMWVLSRLPEAPGAGPDQDVLAHLDACASCRELALAYRAAGEECAGRSAVPDRAYRPLWLGPATSTLRRARGPRFPRLSVWRALVAGGVAAGLLVAVLYPILRVGSVFASEPLWGRFPIRSGDFGDRPEGRGDHLLLRIDLRCSAYVYAVVGHSTGLSLETAWAEPTGGPESEPLSSKAPGPMEIVAAIPEGALEASCAVIATRERLTSDELEELVRASHTSEESDARQILRALERRSGGNYWYRRLVPEAGEIEAPDLRLEFLSGIDSWDETALQSWVREHGRGPAAVLASLLEGALDIESSSERRQQLDEAERLSRAWIVVRNDKSLLERTEAYRRWADSPMDLAEKRRLDRAIQRNVAPHDDNVCIFWRPVVPASVTLPEICDVARMVAIQKAAEEFYREAADAYRRLHDPWGEIECLLRSGFCAPSLEARRAACEKAMDLSRETGYVRGESLAEFGLTFYLWNDQQALPGEVMDRWKDVIESLREIQLWEPLGVAENDLGLMCIQNGLVGEAFRYLKDSVRIQRRTGSKRDEANALQKLAWCHELVGRHAEARDLARHAAEILHEINGPTRMHEQTARILEARSYGRAASAARRLGGFVEAIDLATKGKIQADSIQDYDDSSRCSNVLARAYLGLERYDDAFRSAVDALVLSKQHPGANLWREGEALASEGLALRKLERREEAMRALEAALSLLTHPSVADRLGALEVLEQIAGLQEQLDRPDDALRSRTRWLDLAGEVLDAKGLTVLDRSALRDQLRDGFVAGVRLAKQLKATWDADDPAGSATMGGPWAALKFLEGVRSVALEQLGEHPASGSRRTEIELARVAAALDQDTAWLEYLQGPDDGYVLVVRRDGAVVKSLGLGAGEATRRSLAFIRAICGRDEPRSVALRAQAVYDAYLAPVARELEGCSLVLVSPDPAAPGVPFEALVRDPNDFTNGLPRYEVLDKAMAYWPSAGVLLESRQGKTSSDVGSLDFLGVACPSMSGTTSRPFRSARREVETISRLFADGRAAVLLGDDAQEGIVDSAYLSGFRFVHLASNAHDLSALELASSRAREEMPLLSVAEVGKLPRLSAEIVVLSGGGLKLGDRDAPAPNASGLPGAFLSRGAASVISPLWTVSGEEGAGATQEPTELLMVRFYEEILTGHCSKAEALRRAKLALLRGESAIRPSATRTLKTGAAAWDHPYFWASLVLQGGSD